LVGKKINYIKVYSNPIHHNVKGRAQSICDENTKAVVPKSVTRVKKLRDVIYGQTWITLAIAIKN